MGINRARRLWRQAGVGLPRKRPRHRLAASRPGPLPPRAANHVCAHDFVFESCANGQQLKCLTVLDEFTHESFNGKFRDECLSVESFRTRREAQVIIEAWRQHYNAVRPHSSLDYLTPHEFKQHHPPIHDLPNRAISQK